MSFWQQRDRQHIHMLNEQNRRIGTTGTVQFADGRTRAVRLLGFPENRQTAKIEYVKDGEVIEATCGWHEITFDN